jgi:hypothetical protein
LRWIDVSLSPIHGGRNTTALKMPQNTMFLRFFKRSCRDRSLPDTSSNVKANQHIHRLRVFPPSSNMDSTGENITEEIDRIAGTAAPKKIEVSLADIAPVIADAVASGRGWLADFADDTVQIDADLYEVLLAYQQMRRFNAA